MVKRFVSLKRLLKLSFWEFGANRLVCKTCGLVVDIFRVSLKSDMFFSGKMEKFIYHWGRTTTGTNQLALVA